MTKEELIKLSRENLRKSKQGSLCECYDEAFIKGYQLSEKRITELERKLEQIEKDLADYQFNYPTIKELQKENAELKDKLNKIERKCKFNFVDLLHDVENESKQEEQLTKAKELLRDVLPYIDLTDCVNSDPRLVLYDKIKSLIEEEE